MSNMISHAREEGSNIIVVAFSFVEVIHKDDRTKVGHSGR